MAETPKLTIQISNEAAGDTSIKVPPPGRIALSAEARRTLLEALKAGDGGFILPELEGVFGNGAEHDPEDRDWMRVEDALLEILMPVRYVTAQTPVSRALREDTPANERLTPLPLHEQRPGAWNFVEPRP